MDSLSDREPYLFGDLVEIGDDKVRRFVGNVVNDGFLEKMLPVDFCLMLVEPGND